MSRYRGEEQNCTGSKAELNQNMAKEETGGPGPVDPPTARRRQDALGRRLRQMYDDVVREPVPDDLLSFLKKADDRKNPDGSPNGSGGKTGK